MPVSVPASNISANKPRIARAERSDARLLAGLHGACFTGPHQRAWDEKEMAQFIAGPGTLCLLAFITETQDARDEPQGHDVPTGFLIARAGGDEAELLSIGVLPTARRRGTGKALLHEARTILRACGIACLFLEVDEGNYPACALYDGLSARPVGRRLKYYDNGANAALYRLDF